MLVATDLFTLGQIAQELGRPIHRILYVVKSRKVEPVARAGAYRLFGPEEVARIKGALDGIDARWLTAGAP